MTWELVGMLVVAFLAGWLIRGIRVLALLRRKTGRYQVIVGQRVLYAGDDLKEAKRHRSEARLDMQDAHLWVDGVDRS